MPIYIKCYCIPDVIKLGSDLQLSMDPGADKRVTWLTHDEDKRFGRLDHALEVIQQGHDGLVF